MFQQTIFFLPFEEVNKENCYTSKKKRASFCRQLALPLPENLLPELKNFLSDCMKENPKERPSFTEILTFFLL